MTKSITLENLQQYENIVKTETVKSLSLSGNLLTVEKRDGTIRNITLPTSGNNNYLTETYLPFYCLIPQDIPNFTYSVPDDLDNEDSYESDDYYSAMYIAKALNRDLKNTSPEDMAKRIIVPYYSYGMLGVYISSASNIEFFSRTYGKDITFDNNYYSPMQLNFFKRAVYLGEKTINNNEIVDITSNDQTKYYFFAIPVPFTESYMYNDRTQSGDAQNAVAFQSIKYYTSPTYLDESVIEIGDRPSFTYLPVNAFFSLQNLTNQYQNGNVSVIDFPYIENNTVTIDYNNPLEIPYNISYLRYNQEHTFNTL